MTQQKMSILLVEDSSSTAVVYKSYLEPTFDVSIVESGLSALQHFEQYDYDAVLLDVKLPDFSGLEVLEKIRRSNQTIPIVIITAHGSVDMAIEAMQLGANDFLAKPFDKARLEVTLNNLLKGSQLRQIVDKYEKSCLRNGFFRMIGSSLSMQSVYNIIENSASSKATVFITGESGTGKELCAEAIHAKSQRSEAEFVALNCAAIPRELMESEIFGHVKGAFTGATNTRQGAASRSNGGTLFLDEIGEMPLDLQSKLLRFVQTGCFQPVGSNKEISVDVRFVCATNRNPVVEVNEGRFREDLYYRLHVIPIHMPPLRERRSDCLQIANAMLEEYNQDEGKGFVGFSKEVEAIFVNYRWPGNVRELGNVVRNTVVLNDAQYITKEMLPNPVNQADGTANLPSQIQPLPEATVGQIATEQASKDYNRIAAEAVVENEDTVSNGEKHASQVILPLWIAEKSIIEKAIQLCDGNIPKAAAFLDISASTIYRKKQCWSEKIS